MRAATMRIRRAGIAAPAMIGMRADAADLAPARQFHPLACHRDEMRRRRGRRRNGRADWCGERTDPAASAWPARACRPRRPRRDRRSRTQVTVPARARRRPSAPVRPCDRCACRAARAKSSRSTIHSSPSAAPARRAPQCSPPIGPPPHRTRHVRDPSRNARVVALPRGRPAGRQAPQPARSSGWLMRSRFPAPAGAGRSRRWRTPPPSVVRCRIVDQRSRRRRR